MSAKDSSHSPAPLAHCRAGVGGPGPTITHNGSNTMWFATVLAAPERGLGFIALSNDGVAGQRACTTLVRRLAEACAAA